MCARDEPTKGWKVSIEAVLQCIELGFDITLDLIGSGEHLQSLEKKYCSNESIRFWGHRPIPRQLTTSMILVFCLRHLRPKVCPTLLSNIWRVVCVQ